MKDICFSIVTFFILSTPACLAGVFNVKDFGATGNQTELDQQAIQSAIDACSEKGGGTVFLPTGDYLSGTLRLKSNIALHLSAGATLWASTKPADYPGKTSGRLLVAEHADNISIIGQGTIHGQGTEDYGARWGVPERPPFRTGILLFEQCNNITIRDITILYSDSWTLHLKRCERVVIDGVTIFNNVHRLNSDGIDPNSCRDVHISNCHIVAGDDCIVMKATEPYPCENIVVTNCTLETTTTALKLGTESQGDFRDIHISNCTISRTRTGIGFFLKDGAAMERITFTGISIENFKGEPPHDVFPIFMDIEKRHADSKIGVIRDVIFRDILIRSGSGILIQGMPENPIENITLQNIVFRAPWADDYSNRKKAVGGRRTFRDDRDTKYARKPSYMTIANVKWLHLDNVQMQIDPDASRTFPRSIFHGYQIENGILRGLWGDSNGDNPFLSFHDCRNILLSDCQTFASLGIFLSITGSETHQIQIGDNLHSSMIDPIRIAPEVASEEVRYHQ